MVTCMLLIMCQVYRIEGPSWLDTSREFDCVRGTAVDYMHCVLLGVCKQLLHLCLDSKHHQDLWYIGNNVPELDTRLLTIKPPSEVKRAAQSIMTTRKYWKGMHSAIVDIT